MDNDPDVELMVKIFMGVMLTSTAVLFVALVVNLISRWY